MRETAGIKLSQESFITIIGVIRLICILFLILALVAIIKLIQYANKKGAK